MAIAGGEHEALGRELERALLLDVAQVEDEPVAVRRAPVSSVFVSSVVRGSPWRCLRYSSRKISSISEASMPL